MNKQNFVTELSKLRASSTFLTLHKYRSAESEVADHMIVFHISYENALRKSLAILNEVSALDELGIRAKDELTSSFNESLSNFKTRIEDIDDAYQRFFDEDGSYIKGVRMHRESGNLSLYGLTHCKRVHIPGVYKTVNSKPLTLAKNKLRELCPVSRFRQYTIRPEQVEKINVQHLSLLPPEA